jgi:tetratricopeptide (TPR) repeat protein
VKSAAKQQLQAKPSSGASRTSDSARGMRSSFAHPTLLICAFLALSTLAIYWSVTRHGFVNFDDTDFVTENKHVQAGLTWEGIKWAFSPYTEVARNWHPLTMLTHMVDCELFGLNAGMHHLVTLLYHIANTLLLFFVLRKMTGALWRSAIVAMLFAVHPLHVESVAWMAERKDVLSTLFWMLVMWTYVDYARTRSKAKYILTFVFLACGLMSKPMLVTMPFVLLLMDYWPLRRMAFTSTPSAPPAVKANRAEKELHANDSFGWLLIEKVPFLILSLLLCLVTFHIQKTGGAMVATDYTPLGTRTANAFVSYGKYVVKMFWPENLCGLYLRHGDWPIGVVAPAVSFVIGMCAAAVALAKRKPYFTFGWFYFLGTLVPVIGIVQVGMQAMADRFTYIPMTGLFVLIVWGVWDLAIRFSIPKPVLAGAAGVAFVACAAVTLHIIPFWTNSETLFNRMISVDPNNFMGHYNLANQYNRKGNREAAIEQFEAALKAEPNYPEAHNNLAGVYQDQRQFDKAIAEYKEAARINNSPTYVINLGNAYVNASRYAEAIPYYEQAQRMDPSSASARTNSALAHYAWANQLSTSNRLAEAESHYRSALQLNATYPDAASSFGLCLAREGQMAEAGQQFAEANRLRGEFKNVDPIALAELNLANYLAANSKLQDAVVHYQAAAKIDSNNAEIFNGLGICYAMLGDMPNATKQFTEALRLHPDDAAAHGNLANALAAQNKIDEAIPHYTAALKNNTADYQAHFNLALSLSRVGRKDDAIAHYQEALRINPNYPEAQRALAELQKK